MKWIVFGWLLCITSLRAEVAELSWSSVLPTSNASHFRIVTPFGTKSDQALPLLVFLHGAGEQGDDMVLNRGLPLIEKQLSRFPMRVAATQLPVDEPGWSPDLVDKLIRSVQRQYKVDESRIYLTGIGIGAAGSLLAGISYPGRFAAIVPLAGIDPESLLDFELSRQSGPLNRQLYCRLASTPVWQIQGALDPISPPELIAEIQQALQDCNAPSWLQLKKYSEHDVWSQFYNKSAFYQWILKQQLSQPWQPYSIAPERIRALNGSYRQGQEYLTLDWQEPYLKVRLNSWSQPMFFIPIAPDLFASSVGTLEVIHQPTLAVRLARTGLYLPN